MKVTVLTYSFPTVSETFIARHAAYLSAEIVCREKTISLPSEYNGIQRVYSPDEAHRSAAIRSMQRQWGRVRWHVNRYLAPQRNFIWDRVMKSFWREYLDRRRPDVVLAEYGPNAINAAPECLRWRIPVIPHFHGFDASTLMGNTAYRRELKELFAICPGIVCVSELQRRILCAEGCPSQRIYVIPCGAPVEEFVPSETVGEQPCRFVAVSRLVEVKGPMVLMRSFLEVYREHPEVRLTYAGDGPLLRDILHFIRVNRLSQAVDLVGSIPNDAVRRLLRDSSVFVQASLTDSKGAVEGNPVSLSEALATGLPAVVSRSGGMVDMVIDGQNGFLFEEGDWRQMASKMSLLAGNPTLRLEMGRRGRMRVEKVGSNKINLLCLRNLLVRACAEFNRRTEGCWCD